MSKTITRNSEAIPKWRELREDELEHVSGGSSNAGNVVAKWDVKTMKRV